MTAGVGDLEKNKMGPCKGWSLPGQTLDSAAIDLARTTCRRAERRVAAVMMETKNSNAEIVRYLNRLSDLCWLLARYAEQLTTPS